MLNKRNSFQIALAFTGTTHWQHQEAQTTDHSLDRLRKESKRTFRKFNEKLSYINTGFLRPAIAFSNLVEGVSKRTFSLSSSKGIFDAADLYYDRFWLSAAQEIMSVRHSPYQRKALQESIVTDTIILLKR